MHNVWFIMWAAWLGSPHYISIFRWHNGVWASELKNCNLCLLQDVMGVCARKTKKVHRNHWKNEDFLALSIRALQAENVKCTFLTKKRKKCPLKFGFSLFLYYLCTRIWDGSVWGVVVGRIEFPWILCLCRGIGEGGDGTSSKTGCCLLVCMLFACYSVADCCGRYVLYFGN